MLKQLILLFNLISMSFVTIFLADGIEIESNLPNELVKDSTYIVEVVIKKGDLFGFAKFQQNFPEGFDAKPVETSEASFTFADGRMKFIWMALPEKEEVKISYAVTAMEGAPKESIVDGKFSFIQDNERKSYDIPNKTITIITIISDEVEEEKVPAIASAARIVKPLGNNTYQVDLTISKQGVYGFAKLEEFLPIGAEAEVMDDKKSVFSQVDEKAKFVWMSIPDDADLVISYQVKAPSDILSQLQSMEGNLAFLDENETKTVPVLGVEVDESAAMAAVSEEASEEVVPMGESIEKANSEELANVAPVETPEEVNETEVKAAEEPVVEVAEIEEIPEEIVEEPVRIADNSNEPIAPVTSIPDPQTGIVYRVQIVAGKKLVPNAQIKKTYAFKEEFFTENHEGWVKYITGQFDVYKSARDKRENLVAANHKFPGPFVTAYNAGERITVQEALMISNQKWFK
ncbi:MAG TPA: hypothetical protein DCR48_02410 [Flavobacteriales bacterium]|nr:hypothetical protein [Flavobacteriales bacterium]